MEIPLTAECTFAPGVGSAGVVAGAVAPADAGSDGAGSDGAGSAGAGPAGAGSAGAGPADAGPADAVPAALLPDAPAADAPAADAAVPDTAAPNTAVPDTAVPDTAVPDAAPGGALVDAASLVAGLGCCSADYDALSDADALAGQRTLTQLQHELDTRKAWMAKTLTHRSRWELGQAGLASQQGHISPESLIQKLTGATKAETRKLVDVGRMLAEAEEADAQQKAAEAEAARRLLDQEQSVDSFDDSDDTDDTDTGADTDAEAGLGPVPAP